MRFAATVFGLWIWAAVVPPVQADALPANWADMSLSEREAVIVSRADGAVRREGCRLSLRLKSGKSVHFDDYGEGACANPPEKARFAAMKVDWHRYTLESYRADCDLFAVNARYDENDDKILIDMRNGRRKDFRGYVDLSPTCAFVVETAPESEAFEKLPPLRIWRRAGTRYVQDWRYAPRIVLGARHSGITSVRWISDTRLAFLCDLCGEDHPREMFVRRRHGGGWFIVAGREVPQK